MIAATPLSARLVWIRLIAPASLAAQLPRQRAKRGNPRGLAYAMPTANVCNRQFVVADPDGYLLRFFDDLGDASHITLVEVDEVVLDASQRLSSTTLLPTK